MRAAKLVLSNMESLAVTGIIYRYERELDEIKTRRNKDMQQVLVEHGKHDLPSYYQFRMEDGYVKTIEWDEDNLEEGVSG